MTKIISYILRRQNSHMLPLRAAAFFSFIVASDFRFCWFSFNLLFTSFRISRFSFVTAARLSFQLWWVLAFLLPYHLSLWLSSHFNFFLSSHFKSHSCRKSVTWSFAGESSVLTLLDYSNQSFNSLARMCNLLPNFFRSFAVCRSGIVEISILPAFQCTPWNPLR